MRHPLAFGSGGRFNRRLLVADDMVQAIADPIDMLFDRTDHVGEHRRAAGAGDHEQVGKPCDHQPEIGLRPLRPALLHRHAAPAPDVDTVNRTGHRIKAGGEHDGIDRIVTSGGPDAVRGNPLNRCRLDIDQADIAAVEGGVIIRVHTQPLGAIGIVLRRQQIGDGRVFNDAADFGGSKIGGDRIGRRVNPGIGKGSQDIEPADLPPPFKLGDLLLRRHIHRHDFARVIEESTRRQLHRSAIFAPFCRPVGHFVGPQRTIVGRNAVIGCPLKDCDMRSLGRDYRDRLDRR